MTKLFLHIGTQKTGTTAIQAFAARHRAALAERGLHYPGLEPHPNPTAHPHHLLTRAVSQPVEGLDGEAIAALVARWRAETDRCGAAIFFSAETLYRRVVNADRNKNWFKKRRRYMNIVADIFRDFDVEAILVFRQPDDFVRSAFQESVDKSAGGTPWQDFPQFRRKLLKTRLRYAENAALLAEVFPNLTLMTFDDLLEGGALAPNFFRRLGIDVSDLSEAGVVRRSPTPAETMVRLFLLNEGRIRDRQKAKKLFASRRLRKQIETHLGPGPFGIWEGEAERAAFIEGLAEEMERLRIERFSDRAILFPRLGKGALHPPPPEFPAGLREFLLAQDL